jgi:hypothetical protein
LLAADRRRDTKGGIAAPSPFTRHTLTRPSGARLFARKAIKGTNMTIDIELRALRHLAVTLHARQIAATELGDPDFAPLVAQHLAISVANGVAAIDIVDRHGRPRTIFDTAKGRFLPITAAGLAQELTDKHPALKQKLSTEHTPEKVADTLTAEGAARRAEATKAVAAENAAVVAKARVANPWSKRHFNLTAQMAVLRLDRDLASKLRSEAGA